MRLTRVCQLEKFMSQIIDTNVVVVLNMLDVPRQIGVVPKSGSLGERVGIWLQNVAAFSARKRSSQ
jgi:hypothetical protein